MTSNIIDLQEKIRALSNQDRESLLSEFKFEASRERKVSREEMAVFEAIKKASYLPQSQEVFITNYGVHKYQEKVDYILTFIKSTRKFLKWSQINALIDTIIACLVCELKRRKIDVSPRTILDNVTLLAYAVDQDFPGYVEANMLHRVVGG